MNLFSLICPLEYPNNYVTELMIFENCNTIRSHFIEMHTLMTGDKQDWIKFMTALKIYGGLDEYSD